MLVAFLTCPVLASCFASTEGSRSSASPRSLTTHSPPSFLTRTLADFTSLRGVIVCVGVHVCVSVWCVCVVCVCGVHLHVCVCV